MDEQRGGGSGLMLLVLMSGIPLGVVVGVTGYVTLPRGGQRDRVLCAAAFLIIFNVIASAVVAIKRERR